MFIFRPMLECWLKSFSKHRLPKESSVNLSTNFPEKRRLSFDLFRKRKHQQGDQKVPLSNMHNCGL